MNIEKIRKIVKEVVENVLNESKPTGHFQERYNNRIGDKTPQSQQNKNDVESISYRLEYINFTQNKSFGIFVTKLDVDVNSPYYINEQGSDYYNIDGSIGNEVWIVIRDNKLITMMVRKDIQTSNPEKNRISLGVDFIIHNLEGLINNAKLDENKINALVAKGQKFYE